jgi:molybdate transport system substrate-binding protein
MWRRVPLLAAIAALVLAACGSSGGSGSGSTSSLSGTVNVFAAASLTDSFNALGAAFHRDHPGVALLFNYAGSPTLVTQIEQGAPADMFASADMTNMNKLRDDGYTSGTPQVFAHNQLEIAVAPGNPKGITGLADLAKAGVVYISAGPTVPAGKYAMQSLQKAGVTVTPRSLETDVKSVISKIELGEADAGIVYTTDVKAAGSKIQGIPIPDQYNVMATYPIAVVRDSKQAAVDDAFIAFVLSSEGQTTLASFGFLPA